MELYIILLLVLILLLILPKNIEYFSGGTVIQANSNDASLNETTLSYYIPDKIKGFYDEKNDYAMIETECDYLKNRNSLEKYIDNEKNGIYNADQYIVSNNYYQVKK